MNNGLTKVEIFIYHIHLLSSFFSPYIPFTFFSSASNVQLFSNSFENRCSSSMIISLEELLEVRFM